ncbi:ankyrin repeat domain-containing protein [Burkholderia vietnamiensis]|nr:ankyrin repeat domain-containing protein [Burkholderia vietnamiensis]
MLKISENFTRIVDLGESDAQPYANDAPVSYQPAYDLPLPRFEGSTKHSQIVRQYRVGADKLNQFLHERNSSKTTQAKAGLDDFNEKIAQGSRGFFSSRVETLYGAGKRAFDEVCSHVDNKAIPEHTRLARIEDMALGLTVCSEGALSNIMMTAQALHLSAGGIKAHALKHWEDLLHQSVRDFVQAEHGTEEFYANNEIHYVNAYRNALASRYGVSPREDAFAPPTGLDQRQRCEEYVARQVTAARMTRQLAEQCLSELHDLFPRYRNRPLSEDEVGEIYQLYGDTLQAALETRYGKIEANAFVNEHQPGGTSDKPYTLIENPTLLMRAISRNLRDAGAFEPFKALRVGETRDGLAIKRTGDAFYVKIKTEDGNKGYRPVNLSDLNSVTQGQELVHAALENSQDVDMLRGLSAETVWAMLTDKQPPRDWFAELSGSVIMKYRRASQINEMLLMEKVNVAIDAATEPRRQQYFYQATKQHDEVLATCIAAHLRDVNRTDNSGKGALHYAAAAGLIGPIDTLLKRRSLVDIKDSTGNTPLILAALGGHADAIEALLKARAHPNHADIRGFTALMIAAHRGDVTSMELLRKSGAHINTVSMDGWTALMFAAHRGHVDMIATLLKAGANWKGKNQHQQSALDLARAVGCTEGVALLEKAQGRKVWHRIKQALTGFPR